MVRDQPVEIVEVEPPAGGAGIRADTGTRGDRSRRRRPLLAVAGAGVLVVVAVALLGGGPDSPAPPWVLPVADAYVALVSPDDGAAVPGRDPTVNPARRQALDATVARVRALDPSPPTLAAAVDALVERRVLPEPSFAAVEPGGVRPVRALIADGLWTLATSTDGRRWRDTARPVGLSARLGFVAADGDRLLTAAVREGADGPHLRVSITPDLRIFDTREIPLAELGADASALGGARVDRVLVTADGWLVTVVVPGQEPDPVTGPGAEPSGAPSSTLLVVGDW
ncbi:MAG: hypothetical protein D6683_15260 [Actinomyces sp.]|nr:MAG: hypothetical protein D6683_15260 [Actinomyces sp.]